VAAAQDLDIPLACTSPPTGRAQAGFALEDRNASQLLLGQRRPLGADCLLVHDLQRRLRALSKLRWAPWSTNCPGFPLPEPRRLHVHPTGPSKSAIDLRRPCCPATISPQRVCWLQEDAMGIRDRHIIGVEISSGAQIIPMSNPPSPGAGKSLRRFWWTAPKRRRSRSRGNAARIYHLN